MLLVIEDLSPGGVGRGGGSLARMTLAGGCAGRSATRARAALEIVGTLQLIYARILCLCVPASFAAPATGLSAACRPGVSADHASGTARECTRVADARAE